MKIAQSIGLILAAAIVITAMAVSTFVLDASTDNMGIGIFGLGYTAIMLLCLFVYACTGGVSTIQILKGKHDDTALLASPLWRSIYYANLLAIGVLVVTFMVLPIVLALVS